MNTNKQINALTDKLIDLSGRSRLLKYPNSKNKSSVKLDLRINLTKFLRLVNADTLDEINWTIPTSSINKIDKENQDEQKNLTGIEFNDKKLPLEEFEFDLSDNKFSIYDRLNYFIYKNKIDTEDKGVHTLFLSYGQLTWSTVKFEFNAPLLLIPINILNNKKKDFEINNSSNSMEASLNPALFLKYKQQNELRRDIDNVIKNFDAIKTNIIESIKKEDNVSNVDYQDNLRIGLYPLSPLWAATKDNLKNRLVAMKES